jgi:alanyl-tRNA synthetase
MTKKLYLEEPYRRSFSSAVTEVVHRESRTGIVLEETCFYPLSGGQLPDRGTLGGAAVVDVEEASDGRVIHWLDRPPETEGIQEGEIDWDVRYDHMQQHTGQHLLSRCFLELFDWPTVSFHMGEAACTIDLDTAQVSEDSLARAQSLAGKMVYENRAVFARSFARGDIEDETLRGKVPADQETIRIVEIDGFDRVPCCGTHVGRTGEIGGLLVTGHERAKKRIRLTFLAGERYHRACDRKHRVLVELGSMLTTGEEQCVDSVRKLMEENKSLRHRVQELEKERLAGRAEELVGEAPAAGDWRAIVLFEEEADPSLHRELAQLLRKTPRTVTVLGSGRERTRWICARGEGVERSMTKLLNGLLEPFGGKGGGTEDIAQGGGPGPDRAPEVLARARTILNVKEPD